MGFLFGLILHRLERSSVSIRSTSTLIGCEFRPRREPTPPRPPSSVPMPVCCGGASGIDASMGRPGRLGTLVEVVSLALLCHRRSPRKSGSAPKEPCRTGESVLQAGAVASLNARPGRAGGASTLLAGCDQENPGNGEGLKTADKG
jgi:hypothetical protein